MNNHYFCRGEVAEWSIAAVLKTVEPRGSGGSNPSLSAKTIKKLAERLAFLLLERWKSLLLHRKKAKKERLRLLEQACFLVVLKHLHPKG